MKTITLKFDVGDKAYRIYGEKVIQCLVDEVQVHRLYAVEGKPIPHRVKYHVVNLDTNGYSTWLEEDAIAVTQRELFESIRLTGPDHEENLWTQVFGPAAIATIEN